jgi:hypothetical protein
MQGFLLHIHDGLQDHLRSVLDSILDWCVQVLFAATIIIAIAIIAAVITIIIIIIIIITITIIVIIPTAGTLGLTRMCCAAWMPLVGWILSQATVAAAPSKASTSRCITVT